MQQARTRTQLHHYATTYEIVAVIPGRDNLRLGFTSRPSKATLIRMAQANAEAILPHIGSNDAVRYSAKDGLRLGRVVVRKSGLTERECSDSER